MKIKATCAVESLTVLPEKVEFEYNGKQYIFIPNEQNYLSEIQLITNVDKPEKFNSTWRKERPEDKQETLTIRQDEEQIAAIRTEFQDLESLLAFTHNVKRLEWSGLQYELILESEEDRKITDVTKIDITFDYPDKPKLAEPDQLYLAVATKNGLADLTEALAYWREAYRDFMQHRYINAFYNFYFILEGFYGGGKWRNYEVGEEFKASELSGYIDYFLNNTMIGPKADPLLQPRLTEMINNMNANNAGRTGYVNQSLDIGGIVTLIIDTRGSLHHYNPATSQRRIFNHKEYRHIAFLLFALTTSAVIPKMAKAGIPIKKLMPM